MMFRSPADPRLDWRPMHDLRSLSYPVTTALPKTLPAKRLWRAPNKVLDQGREGACVGFAWGAELGSSPIRVEVNDAFARSIYKRAQQLDPWEGENYEGTSVLAGAQTCVEMGLIGEYRWAFSISELRDAVLGLGPAVIGIPWLSGMYRTRPSGLMDVTGTIVGGHAILVRGYHPRMRIKGEGWFARHEVFVLRNSWGGDYGKGGDAYIRAADLAALLAQRGEMCVPLVRRQKKPLP